MSLTILVIGRGDGEHTFPNGHTLHFREFAEENHGYADLMPYAFVFQHLSPANPEADEAIQHWCSLGWEAKIIGFSGGSLPEDWRTRGFPYIENLSGRPAILGLAWSAVPPVFLGSARDLVDLLLPGSLDTLAGLAILCQGYLSGPCRLF